MIVLRSYESIDSVQGMTVGVDGQSTVQEGDTKD